MKLAVLPFLILCTASLSFAQEDKKENPDEKKGKLIQSLNLDSLDLAIQPRDTQVQVQVEVAAEEYPGLNMDVESPAASMEGYKPYTKRELQAYSDLLLDYSLTDYDRSETARPHKPARLFRTTLPTD
jgi:hypothetical protein